MRRNRPHFSPAFTLIELLVVVAIIALLISILLPALGRAREQTKSAKCLSNLKTLGQAVVVYTAEERGGLPGRLHPAVYRNQGLDSLLTDPVKPLSMASALEFQAKQLTFFLRRQFTDSQGRAGSVTDQVATCPTQESVNPDSNFALYIAANPLGNSAFPYPFHYALNNHGTYDENGVQSGQSNGQRATNPEFYFGFKAPAGTTAQPVLDTQLRNPPKQISTIKRASEEWMLADAWYRRTTSNFSELQQEGPYQSNWSGEALPFFAPHFAKGLRSNTIYSSSSERQTSSVQVRKGRKDGRTNSVFFDGHAAPVVSKRLVTPAGLEILYGFPGTVNPLKASPPAPADPNTPSVWDSFWRD